MTTEIEVEGLDLVQKEAVDEVVEERQYSDDEIKAMDHGWVPKDQWKGPADEWVPAKVFNIRGELFGRIAQDKKTINELRQSVDALVDHSRKSYDAGYKKALDELKRDKRAALDAGDTSAVMQIDDEIDELREQHETQKKEFEQRVTAQAAVNNVPVEFEVWRADNTWYQSDPTLTVYADQIGQDLYRQAYASGRPVEWAKLYSEVGRKVRQKFPEKFETRTRQSVKGGDVVDSGEGVTATRPSTSGLRESDLSEDERRIMNNILKTTDMTKKEYLDQMAKYSARKSR